MVEIPVGYRGNSVYVGTTVSYLGGQKLYVVSCHREPGKSLNSPVEEMPVLGGTWGLRLTEKWDSRLLTDVHSRASPGELCLYFGWGHRTEYVQVNCALDSELSPRGSGHKGYGNGCWVLNSDPSLFIKQPPFGSLSLLLIDQMISQVSSDSF